MRLPSVSITHETPLSLLPNALTESFLRRDQHAIEDLHARYGNYLLSICMNVLGNREDSEECLNDAYLAVWNTVPPQRPDPLLSYVCRIVRNQALKRYHANTAGKRNSVYDAALEELAECLPAAGSPQEAAEAKEIAGIINAFLETLDPGSRVLFVRRYWHADSIGELAEAFRLNKHAVSVRLSRIRKALRKRLEEEGVTL